MGLKGILIIILSGCLLTVRGQEPVRFHSDPALFISEVRALFGENPPDNVRSLISALETAQRKDLLEENHWIDLAGKSNRFNELRYQAYPDYFLLIRSFLEVAGQPEGREFYFTWTAHVDGMLGNDRKSIERVRDFLNFTYSQSRTGVLNQTQSFAWKARPGLHRNGKDSAYFIVVPQSDLVASGNGDSTVIFSTTGKYYPDSRIFYGKGGMITWQRLGLPPGQVRADLGEYRLDLAKSIFRIDSVYLTDTRYFSEPVPGRIENRIIQSTDAQSNGYPRFTSSLTVNRIKNIYPGFDYEGGFSLHGLRVLGTGEPDRKSVLTLYRNQAPFMRFASTYFSLLPEQARGINAESTIYLESDSIYHPGLLFQYNPKKGEVSLIRDGNGQSPSRYFNSYHKFDLDVGWLRWNIGDSLITMSGVPGSIENRAFFESSDFFSMDRYNEILVRDKVHPVSAVKQCADYLYSRQFSLYDLAKFMSKPDDLVEEMLLRLSYLGFVRYNSENRQVEVEERTYDFLKKNAGIQDYDIIRFESVHEPPEPNAILNLNTNRIKVFWVRSVSLSESRMVAIIPKGQTIEILKGRDLIFDGEIIAGLADFQGNGFRFNYEDFSIRMNQIGKLNLHVYEKNGPKNREPLKARVTSVIEYTSGTLEIDAPDYKSGIYPAERPQYPLLRTDTNAFVYYDQKEILDGIYKRDSFKFNIYPFVLRGLTSLNFSDSLIFPGRFETAGIFPVLELALRHQSDHSLGFETQQTPPEGYPVYGGKGRFYNSLAMSRAGLKGSGKLEYLNSELVSDDILFLPDRVKTVADRLTVSRDTTDLGNPATSGEQMDVTWYPFDDRLVAKKTKGLMDLYGSGQFDGTLTLGPGMLTGRGTIRFEGYTITSDSLRLFETGYEAIDSRLSILDRDKTGKPLPEDAEHPAALVATHYNARVDVSGSKAAFKPSGDLAKVSFAKNRFTATPDEFLWEIDRSAMVLNNTGLQMAAKPSDSLRFRSGATDVDLAGNILYAREVDYIDVADVRVFPIDRNVSIYENARIDSLRNAVIVSRDSTLVHRITGAVVGIRDHRFYTASGNYLYKDIADREFQVAFNDIKPNRNGISVGTGSIAEDGGFSLSPAFRYYGPVEWDNNEPWLLFTGQTKLNYSCPNITPEWIRFEARINPDSVLIPIDSVTTNDSRGRLFKGFYLSNQPVELYSTFIGPHTRYSDVPVITTSGWLWHDRNSGNYHLAGSTKKDNPNADGVLLTLDPERCSSEATGRFNLGVDLGRVQTGAAGRLVHDLAKDSVSGNMILALDFFLDPKVLEYIARSLNNSSGLEAVNYADPEFRQSFGDLLGREKGEELLKQISLTGRWRKIPEELLHTIVFSGIRFKWNPERGAYQSVGKIGISNIMDISVNKKVNGYIEILHRRGGDAIGMYLEVDRQKYFFLSYSRGVMQCVAGPGFEKFNTMVRNTKEGKRKLRNVEGEPPYQYYIGSYGAVQEFLRRFNIQR